MVPKYEARELLGLRLFFSGIAFFLIAVGSFFFESMVFGRVMFAVAMILAIAGVVQHMRIVLKRESKRGLLMGEHPRTPKKSPR